MKPISPLRFDALAGYARHPRTLLFAEELAYYEHADERVLGLLIRDRTDDDFGGLVLAKDKRLRFRCIDVTSFYDRRRVGEIELRRAMERAAAEPDINHEQGDERGRPVDFFASALSDDRLNPHFVSLRDEEIFSAAKGIIQPMMRWYEDADGNFVEQFQTTGFDARIWELYLFATFTEMGYILNHTHAAPDFLCEYPGGEFYVEAVTVNPTRDETGAVVPEPPLDTPEQVRDYQMNYMPIKFGSALTSKLAKKYWERPHVAGKPLVIAIQDFSAPQSMVRSRTGFEHYVTGREYGFERRPDGTLNILPRKIGSHRFGAKEIPSGFFDLPNAENVSAVMFSNSGTISKFNRMGLLAGFGSPRLRLIRVGTAVNLDPTAAMPLMFRRSVNDPGYREAWSEGIDVWHNPNARYPIVPDIMPWVAHHYIQRDGQLINRVPDFHPFGSYTLQAIEK